MDRDPIDSMHTPVSHSKDPDLQKTPQALMRASEKARQLAKQTGTRFVVRQPDTTSAPKQKNKTWSELTHLLNRT